MSTQTRHIWLTGASSGIGHALALELLGAGHQLALSARSREPLEALAQRFPGQVLVAAGDLTDAAQVHEIGQRIAQAWGALDCAILNAGSCEYVDVSHFEAAMVERVLRANLFSAAYCIEAALPLLRKGRQAHLVAIGSSVTFAALPRAEAYGASKAGLRYLMQSLRIDLAAEGIAVTLVSPGFVDTPLTQKNDFPMPFCWPAERAARQIARKLPRQPHEIVFPRIFTAPLRLLGALPSWAQLAIGKRLARPAKENT
jgi:NAD(P)-dependent dehydrogenase (short-subunit alcohol dehydrogenase family)